MIFSMICDEVPSAMTPRHEVREKIVEVLSRPLKPEDQREFDVMQAAKANAAAMAEMGDRYADAEARPMVHPPRPRLVPVPGAQG